jgi:hypothetical protein
MQLLLAAARAVLLQHQQQQQRVMLALHGAAAAQSLRCTYCMLYRVCRCTCTIHVDSSVCYINVCSSRVASSSAHGALATRTTLASPSVGKGLTLFFFLLLLLGAAAAAGHCRAQAVEAFWPGSTGVGR